MKVDLRYGQAGLTVTLPAACEPHIIRKPKMALLQDKTAAVMHALDQPKGCESLESIAGSKKTACILICDVTRPVPNEVFLRPVVERLLSAGLQLSDIASS
jgi:nickel-dependent lactate racemase